MNGVETINPSITDASARHALLDTAEQMFASLGFDGVSMRDLTRQAGTNLSSVNYHFGSKEKLFEEVILRRIRPINQRRLASLQQVLDAAGPSQPPLEKILDAFARPFIIGIDTASRESLRRICVRMFMESDPLVKPIFEREFVPVARQFRAALAQACPDLPQRQVDMAIMFFAGAMVNLMSGGRKMAAILQQAGPPPTDEETLHCLIRFGIAGFAGLKI